MKNVVDISLKNTIIILLLLSKFCKSFIDKKKHILLRRINSSWKYENYMVVQTSWIGENEKERVWVVVPLRTKKATHPVNLLFAITLKEEHIISRQSIECCKQSPQSMHNWRSPYFSGLQTLYKLIHPSDLLSSSHCHIFYKTTYKILQLDIIIAFA